MQSLHSSLYFGRLTHLPSNVARNFSKGYRSRPWFHCTSSTTNCVSFSPSLGDSTHTCHEQRQPLASITHLHIFQTFLSRRRTRIGDACRLASDRARSRVLLSDHPGLVTFRIRWIQPCFPECPELGAVSGASSEPGGDAAQVRWDAQFVRETIDKARDLKMTEAP